MSIQTVIEQAERELRARGASQADVEHARKLLAWLAEHNRSTDTTTVRLAHGVTVRLPANTHARGLVTGNRPAEARLVRH
jgi:hypothetical protein